MAEVFSNSEDTNQMPHSVVSDLGLHCLPITFLGVFRLQWVNEYSQCIFSWIKEEKCHYCSFGKSAFSGAMYLLTCSHCY